jgi:hypothetical protein
MCRRSALGLLVVLGVACWPAGAPAQTAEQITFTDMGADVPGLATVTPYQGWLPPQGLSDVAIPQMPGFPTQMGCATTLKPQRGLVFADLNGDRKLEVIAASIDKKVYAWDFLGQPMPGFPVTVNNYVQYPPTVDDIDGDGDMEIVVLTRGASTGGRLYVIDHLGQVVPPFPISVNNGNLFVCPTVVDLDGNGQKEIIFGERAYPIGRVHVFRPDGTEWTTGWPVAMDHVPAATAAVGDVNRDGRPEIVFLSYNSIYVLDLDGNSLPGWPKQIPNANFSYQSPALADLDHDGDLEIVVGTHGNAPGCYVFHHDATAVAGWPKPFDAWSYCPPVVTDLENDGNFEVIDGWMGGGAGVPGPAFYVWAADGTPRPGFPYITQIGGGSEGVIVAADIDGDGIKEIFADSNIKDGTEGFLYGVDAAGNDLPGFPLRPVGHTYMSGATIADIDGDGDYEMGVLSYEDTVVWVNVYDLPYAYRPTGGEWKAYHARNTRGGLFRPYRAGDLNCDHAVDFGDINPFVLALTNPAAYATAFPLCDVMNADINGNGWVDFGDINPFVRLLTQP